jgi:hypothetical protein
MAENLAEDFVDLRGVAHRADAATELRFNHVEYGFDIRAAMVVLQEILRR